MCITYIEGRFLFMQYKTTGCGRGKRRCSRRCVVTLLTGVWAQGRQSALCGQGRAAARDRRVRRRGGSAREARGAGCAARVSDAAAGSREPGAQDAAAVIAAASGELRLRSRGAQSGEHERRVELGRRGRHPHAGVRDVLAPGGGVCVASRNARRGRRAKLVVRGVSAALHGGRGDRAERDRRCSRRTT